VIELIIKNLVVSYFRIVKIIHGIVLCHVLAQYIELVSPFCRMLYEGKDMGCCGSCGGEAPNHTNDQDKSKDKEKEVASKPQEQDKEKK